MEGLFSVCITALKEARRSQPPIYHPHQRLLTQIITLESTSCGFPPAAGTKSLDKLVTVLWTQFEAIRRQEVGSGGHRVFQPPGAPCFIIHHTPEKSSFRTHTHTHRAITALTPGVCPSHSDSRHTDTAGSLTSSKVTLRTKIISCLIKIHQLQTRLNTSSVLTTRKRRTDLWFLLKSSGVVTRLRPRHRRQQMSCCFSLCWYSLSAGSGCPFRKIRIPPEKFIFST